MTYAFCLFFVFVGDGVQIPMFCLSIVDITMYSWLTEKYSQYDKSCKTAQLNCIQPKSYMNTCSCVHIFMYTTYERVFIYAYVQA